MATAKKTQIVITANAAVAKKVMEELQQRIDGIKQKMAALDVTTKQGQREFNKLKKELVSYNSAVTQNITNEERVKHAIDNLNTTSLKELRRALVSAKSVLGKTFADDPGLKKKQQDVRTLQNQIDKLTGSVHKQGGAWQTAMKNLTAYVGLFQVFNAIKNTVTSAIKKNFEFSSSLTDIRKVSGLAMEDVNKLATELAKIDTRTSIDGLAQLAYQGAKLGMGKYGVEGMKQFVAAADQINVAIGEEMGEEALPALSKLVETMGLIPKMGIEKAMLATGSAMFKLASTSTATSGNIVEFAKRLTGVSRTAGITTDQLLALGSASDSLFLMPEVSATAMSKFIVALQKNHNLIEKDLGIQQGTIKNMYAAGHAMDAIVMVLEKMRDKGNMNALGGIFKDLGSDGQRLVTAMVTMSKNVDVLKDHLYESQEAFEEATAVTNEYKMQQQSAIGILDRANNLWEKAFVNPDGVESVKAMAQAWYDMSQMILQSPVFKNTLQAALWSVITACKVFVTLLPLIANYVAGLGIYKAVTFLWELGKAIKAAATAQIAFNSAAKVNPYVAIASAIVTAVGVVWSFVKADKEAAAAEAEAARKANAWKDKLKEAQLQTDTLTRKLHSYKTTLEALNVSQNARNTQIARFNRDFRQYISKLGIEIKSVGDLKKHYSELAQEIQRATYYRLREEAKQNVMPSYQMDRLNAANRIKKELDKLGLFAGGFTQKTVMDMFNKGAGAGWIWQQIIKANIKDAKQDSFRFNMKTGTYTYTDNNGDTIKANPTGYKGLLSSLVHFQNATKREAAKDKEINDYFNQVVNLDGYTPWVEDEPGTLENEAPDKDAIRAAKQEERDRKRAWREELKQKQDQAKAIMDDVDNYYDRQINAKLAQVISLNMDETEQKQFVLSLKQNKETARSQVRLAVAGKPNKWEDAKKMMVADKVEQADETGIDLSKDLLDGILNNNIEGLRKLMADLGKNLGMSMNSITAQIFAKATRSEQELLKMQLKQQEARRKIVMEHDYTGVVQQNSYDNFNEMGYAAPTKEETTVTKKMVDGKKVLDTSAFDKRRKAIKDMYETARKSLAQLYTIDVSTTDGKGVLMKMLFGNDPDGMAARIKESLGKNEESWKAFYLNLIQYSDEYAAAEKKKYDEAKKITDFWWSSNKRNLAQQERIRKIQNESNLFGKRTNLLSNLGLANLTADPEIELMKARMQAAEDYYAFVERNTKNKQLIDEAERARQEAELAYANQMATAMRSRLSQMKELVQPIEDFGAAVGQALADMKNDADSANEAIKNALKSMLESWGKMALNDVNTQMWKAINDAGAKKGRKDAQPDIQAARDNAKNNYTDFSGIDWHNFGTENSPLWVRWAGDLYEDKSGYAVYTKEEGTPLPNPDGSTPQANEPPAAWKKRHPDGTMDDYNREVQGIAGQTGAAVADVATGQSSLADAGAGVLAAGANAALNAPIGGKSSEAKEKVKQLKEERKHQKELSKEVKKGSKEREKENKKGVDNITKDSSEAGKEQTKLEEVKQNTTNAIVEAGLNTTFQKKQENDAAVVEQSKDTAQAENTFSIVGAIGKCFEFLGPIAGPIAAASVMAILTGLMQWGLNAAFGSKNKKSSSSTRNTKLVSGMLTYDDGNVQDLKPFVADNGEVYWAEEQSGVPQSGVNLLTKPTATTINGQPSLVAERGPELVIGRETTKAMMMNNPSLLKALVNYDRNYSGRNAARRVFDEGNIGEAVGNLSSGASATDELISNATASNAALLQAVTALLARLNEPISAKIDMYGRGNLYDSMTKANQFMKNK
nr:MAG TPA: tail tape measure protein [Caudoviricetes sp.]